MCHVAVTLLSFILKNISPLSTQFGPKRYSELNQVPNDRTTQVLFRPTAVFGLLSATVGFPVRSLSQPFAAEVLCYTDPRSLASLPFRILNLPLQTAASRESYHLVLCNCIFHPTVNSID